MIRCLVDWYWKSGEGWCKIRTFESSSKLVPFCKVNWKCQLSSSAQRLESWSPAVLEILLCSSISATSANKFGQNWSELSHCHKIPNHLHQPLGDFDTAMGFEDILEFEKLNDVQFNMFGYNNRHFFPLKTLSNESNFQMNFFVVWLQSSSLCFDYWPWKSDCSDCSRKSRRRLTFVIFIGSVGIAVGYVEAKVTIRLTKIAWLTAATKLPQLFTCLEAIKFHTNLQTSLQLGS